MAERSLRSILREAIGREWSFVEFYSKGQKHYAKLSRVLFDGQMASIIHPDAVVESRDGKILDMVKGPTSHCFSCENTAFEVVEDELFPNRHVIIKTPERDVHLYIGLAATIAA